jgi:hypothetical protein
MKIGAGGLINGGNRIEQWVEVDDRGYGVMSYLQCAWSLKA